MSQASSSSTLSIIGVFKDGISTGLDKLNRRWTDMSKLVDRVNEKLAPLTGRATQLVAAVASTAAIQKAVLAAEEQAKAEQLVGKALGENVKQLEKIKALATEIQANSLFDDADLLRATNLLLNAGVAVGKIEDSLKVTADTAAALDLEIEQVARSIALFQSNKAGALGRRVPVLRQLAEDGKLAAEGVKKLNELFGGTAQKLASSEFGRFRNRLNLIGDEFERIGNLVIGPVNRGLDVILEKFRAFNTIIEKFRAVSPAIEKLVELGVKAAVIAAALIALATVVKSIIFLFTTLGPILLAVLGPLVQFVTNFGLLGAAAAYAAFKLAQFLGVFEDLKKLLSETLGFLGDVSDGFADFTQLLDQVGLEFKAIGVFWNVTVLGGIVSGLKVLALKFSTGFQKLVNFAKIAGLQIAKAFETAFEDSVVFLAKGVDRLTNALAKGIEALGGEGEKIRTRLEQQARQGGGAAAQYDAVIAQIRESNRLLDKEYVDGLLDIAKQQEANQAQAEKELETEQAKIDAASKQRLEKQLQSKERKKSADDEEQEARRRKIRESSEASAQQELLDQRLAKTKEIRDVEREFQTEVLGRQLRDNLISTEEYYRRRRELQDAAFRDETADIDKELATVKTAIAEELASRERQKNSRKKQIVDITSLLEKQAELEAKLEQATVARRKADAALSDEQQTRETKRVGELQKLLRDLELGALEADKKSIDAVLGRQKDEADELQKQLDQLGATLDERLQATADLASKQASDLRTAVISEARRRTEDLTTAEQKYRQTLEDTKLQLDQNLITEVEARDRLKQALSDVRTEAEKTVASLQALGQQFPQLQPQIAPVIEDIQRRVRQVNADAEQLGFTFEEGLTAGLKQFQKTATDSFAQAKRLVLDVANAVANNLSSAIFDVVSGTKSLGAAFRDFAIKSVQYVAQVIIQLLVLRALASALGLTGLVPVAAATAGANSGGLMTRRGVKLRGYVYGGMAQASPGYIPEDGSPDRDTLLAKLTAGEFVIRRKAVRYYGPQLFAALNRMRLSRASADKLVSSAATASVAASPTQFASGGQVRSGRQESSVGTAVILANDDQLGRLLEGGRGAMLRFLSEHKGQY